MSRNGPGRCGCGETGVYYACKGFASKPFSGWPGPLNDDLSMDWSKTTHYLEYSCVIKQDWVITQYDSDMSTILSGPSVASTTRTIYLRRNRYTNDQTVEVVETGLGMYWGGVNYVGYGSGGYAGYIWPFDIDNYGTPQGVGFVNEGGFLFDNITPPYGTMWHSELGILECVKPEYFINDFGYTPAGDRGWKTNVTFYENYEAVPGTFMKYEVEITINEYLSNPYTLADCVADQALLVAANTIERLRSKSAENKQFTYVGYDSSGTIIYADYGDETLGFYPLGWNVDPRIKWEESGKARNNIAEYPSGSDDYVNYHAANISFPGTLSYPQTHQLCFECKSVFVETGAVNYTLKTYSWPAVSVIGAETESSSWTGSSGRAIDVTADLNSAKIIEEAA